MSRRKESQTAPNSDSSGRSEFEISHPFHPDFGRRLRILHTRVDQGVRWLWYTDAEGRPRQVNECFTDRVEPDAFQRHAAGRCAFAFVDLVRLSGVVERLQRSRAKPSGT
jgi:hypothetical protein